MKRRPKGLKYRLKPGRRLYRRDEEGYYTPPKKYKDKYEITLRAIRDYYGLPLERVREIIGKQKTDYWIKEVESKEWFLDYPEELYKDVEEEYYREQLEDLGLSEYEIDELSEYYPLKDIYNIMKEKGEKEGRRYIQKRLEEWSDFWR